MAKKYHDSKRMMHKEMHHHSHMHESSGSEKDMYRPDRYSGYYEGPERRRYEEMRDAGMIQEDPHAIANLPQAPMIKPYPMNRDYVYEGLDDTIRGVDGQIGLDEDLRDKTFKPKKV